jgi:hypothetical protein
MPDDTAGSPIAYTALPEGTPVFTSDGQKIGTVKRVLADLEDDIFDGLIVDTHDGDRFVDAPNVGDLYERRAELKLSAADATHLPEPTPNPAAMEPTADDVAGETTADAIRFQLQRAWNRISGKY